MAISGNKSIAHSPKEPYERISVDQLQFDTKNPRLVEYGNKPDVAQFDLLKLLWENMAVEELAMSIAYNGYYAHEPIFVEVERKKNVVIEGNRRLAAVKLLLDEDLRKKLRATDLPNIDNIDRGRRAEISSLPVIKTTREAVWRYLGFKHVHGPSTWGAYAKAQYIATVHNEYKVSLDEIAKQIGDYNSTVQRWYRGLMVIEQAEDAQVFDRTDTTKRKFHFNYIYTGLDSPGIKAFLQLGGKGSTERTPVPKSRVKYLGELCVWLYGSQKLNKQSMIRSQNPDLKILSNILLKEDGIQALRDGLPLKVASEISQGDERLFRQSLQSAKQSLQKAYGTMSTGYKANDREVLSVAQEVDELAGDLLTAMIDKRRKASRELGKKLKSKAKERAGDDLDSEV